MSLRIGRPKIPAALVVVCMLCGTANVAEAQVSIGIGLPSVTIGINVPFYPNLIPVPGYPVYYDPRLDSNLFFYDGLYWVYVQDNWYASTWYDGPWDLISAETVPAFLLRIPVRYYRHPPPYFLGWDREAPPRWGEHWGSDWDARRQGWDHWDRAYIPKRAPLPTYQREYSHDRYPRVDQQQTLQDRNYRYRPREDVDRQHFEQPPAHAREPNRAPTEHQRPSAPPPNSPRGNAPAAGQPPAVQHRAPPPSGRDAHDEHRSQPGTDTRDTHRDQPDRRVPQHGNPQTPQPQRPPERREPPRDSHPPQPRTDKPPG
jgi:hypothetical protein